MSKIISVFTKITFYVITFYLFTSIKQYMQMVDLGVRRCRMHDSTNQMLRDAQIIGCADMPQYADMPLLPLQLSTI